MVNNKMMVLLLLSNIFLLGWLYVSNYRYAPTPKLINPHPKINYEYEYVDPFQVYQDYPIDLLNASAIFNTVHGALKQKDANLNPVGVSFIPAYIPPNTRFYHSSGSPNLPPSFEWIAMSSEFSYSFAHFNKGSRKHNGTNHPGGGPGGPDGPEGGPGGPPPPSKDHQRNSSLPFENDAYLYTFRTTKPLDKLILLDGASAAKTSPEMDQQMILSRQKNTTERVQEDISSEKICNWGKKFGLQGIIRMEMGYEIIICDFHKDLELISNITLDFAIETISFPKQEDIPTNELSKQRNDLIDKFRAKSDYEVLKSAEVVDNGEGRIKLDLSNMVTPLNKTYIDPNPYTRNISYLDQELKDNIITELEQIYENSINPYDKTDWQVITKGIETKFGPIFDILNKTLDNFNGSDNALKQIGDDLTILTFNFMRRYNDLNRKDFQYEYGFNSSIFDYVYHTYPLQNADILIYSSIFKVQYEVATIIFKAFDLGKIIVNEIYVKDSVDQFDQLKHQVSDLKIELVELLDILKWSILVDCRTKCGPNEFCYAPAWGPTPYHWRERNDNIFDKIGDHYEVKQDLQCISYTDLM